MHHLLHDVNSRLTQTPIMMSDSAFYLTFNENRTTNKEKITDFLLCNTAIDILNFARWNVNWKFHQQMAPTHLQMKNEGFYHFERQFWIKARFGSEKAYVDNSIHNSLLKIELIWIRLTEFQAHHCMNWLQNLKKSVVKLKFLLIV